MKARHKLLILSAIALCTFFTSLMFGAQFLNPKTIIQALIDPAHNQHFAIWENRLPRALLALAIGAALATSGAIIQGIIHNPLASPDILSINHGASLSAVSCLMLFPSVGLWLLPLSASIGALTAFFILLIIAGKRTGPLKMALIGVALSAFYSAIIDYLMLGARQEINSAILWLTGSLWGRSWHFVAYAFPLIALLLPLSFIFCKALDLLALGEQKAASLGVNVRANRLSLLTLAVIMAGISVSVAGPISFLGLIAPHLARRIVGGRHRYLLPASMLTGAIILSMSDTLVRSIAPPLELPAGVFTALIGAPYFFYLLRRTK